MVIEMKEELRNAAGYLTKEHMRLFVHAIDFAEKAHSGQRRATGEPYVIHPYTVCKILLNYKADTITLISSLLHDVAEDTHFSIKDIEKRFGQAVSEIVDGLTKLEKGLLEKEEYSARNFEKLLTSSANDIRVAIVKIADRLHNMRTLDVKKVEKQVPYANETLVFFSPLAERLGLFKIQKELDDLSFKYLNPPKYKGVRQLLDNYSVIFADLFEFSKEKIKESASQELQLEFDWFDTPIYKSYSLLQTGYSLSDLYTVEVITGSTLQCYTALGMIHGLFQPVENKFQDQIAIKNSLFHRHLTTKVYINNIEVRFEIKTESVKQTQQYGIFSFLNSECMCEDLRKLSSELLRDAIRSVKAVSNDPIEFYELISFELMQRNITVFTPKMDAVFLPEGASALDFAFNLNPQLAKKMSSVRINGEPKSLCTLVKDMDIVEIMHEIQDMVNEGWLNHSHTSKAQKEILDILS